MFKRKETALFIILLVIVVIISEYKFGQYREKYAADKFFNVGQSVVSAKPKDFFDYNVDKNKQIKNHDI